MNPDPTIIISLDYLVELSDDGKQPDQPAPEIIIMPPVSAGKDPVTTPVPAPGTGPRL